jgi:PAS domain-containing protein
MSSTASFIQNQPVMFSVVEAALDENNYGALTLLQEEAIPLQNRLVEALDNMTSLQRQANEAALGKTFAAYQASRNLMLVLGILATTLATLVALLVSRRMLTQTRQLETEKQKYQTLFETNSDAVVILDDKGFTDCNPATLSMFGMDSVDDSFCNIPIAQLGTDSGKRHTRP